jgi:cyclopropane-fatty-acyl-phospholipid synthase
MANSDFKDEVLKILSIADIKINGERPWDIQVHNEDLYRRIIREKDLGLGEAYMDGWWDVKELDQFFSRVMNNHLDEKVKVSFSLLWLAAKSAIFNRQSKSRAFTIGKRHYDTGNDLFQAMLGPSMAYSCAYWENAKDLDEAQNAKYDLICRKIGLKPGMSVLDIGCGWGTFLRHAAKNYGIHGVGVTVSKEQAELARELCEGLPIEISLQDYRELNGKFDRVVSIGMFEHVGYKNHRTFMEVVDRCLKDDGLFLLHTIGSV